MIQTEHTERFRQAEQLTQAEQQVHKERMAHNETVGGFKIRSYSKAELGLLYAPQRNKHNAWEAVKNWIDRCQPLSEALLSSGLTGSTRVLSPRQVELIVQHLGEP